MGDGADGDSLDTGEGDGSDGFEGDAAGGFEGDFSFFARPVAEFDGGLHTRAIHVVEEDDLNAVDFEDFAHLVEAVDFNFDKTVRDFGAAFFDDAGEMGGQ